MAFQSPISGVNDWNYALTPAEKLEPKFQSPESVNENDTAPSFN